MTRRVLVTGATGGIGEAICQQLCQSGFEVLVGYWNREERADQIAASLPGARTLRVELGTAALAEKFSAELDEENLYALVNNAAVRTDGLFLELSDSDWLNGLSVNTLGPVQLMRAVLPSMVRARKGWVVNVTSGVSRIGSPGQAIYSASKAALDSLTRTVAQEVRRRGVGVVGVSPGPVLTRMTSGLTPEQWETVVKSVPLGRMAKASEIAWVVEQVISRNVLALSGSIVNVDGGASTSVNSLLRIEPPGVR
jgi:3-oxoacyl-[acyl-carrier protein] reductase